MINVLYVDDEPALLEITRLYLEKTNDFEVDTAPDAAKALEKIRKNSYDIIVSDYQMPEMDGIVLLKEIRQEFSDTAFILFTGKGREDVVINAINNGADFYLQKGGDPRAQFAELAHKIRQAVQHRKAEKALKDSEERLNRAIEGANLGLWDLDIKRGEVLHNNRWIEMFGYSPDETLTSSEWWVKQVHPDDIARVSEITQDHYSGKIPNFDTIYRIRHKDGRYLSVHSQGRVVERSPTGEPLRMTGVNMDVTKRVTTEEALFESEKRYRNVVEDQSEFISRFLPDGTHVFVNEAYCKYFNKPRDDLIGKKFVPQVPEEERQAVRAHFASLTKENPVAIDTHRIILENGNVRWHQWSDRAIFDEKGTLVEYQSVGRDITESRRNEEELRAAYEQLAAAEEELRVQYDELKQVQDSIRSSEQFLSDIFSSIQDGISISDKNMNILRVNPAMERLYPHAMPIVGKKCWEVFQAKNERCDVCPSIKSLTTGEPSHSEVPMADAEGKTIGWIDLYSFPLRDALTGEITGVIEYVRDGTERWKAQRMVKEREERLRLMNDQIPGSLYTTDANLTITGSYGSGLRDLGLVTNQLVGVTIEEFTGGQPDQAAVLEEHRRALGGASVTYESNFNDRSYRSYLEPLRDDHEEIIGILGFALDITSQKKAESALRESEKLLQDIISNTPDIIWQTDEHGRFLYVSPQVEGLLGYRPDELIGRYVFEFINKEGIEENSEDFRSAAKNPWESIVHTTSWTRRDGHTVLLESHAIPTCHEDGSFSGFRGIDRDITKRTHVEEVLKERESLFHSMVDQLQDSVIILASDGTVLFANPAAFRLVNSTLSELEQPLNISQFIEPCSLSDVIRDLGIVSETGKILNSEYQVRTINGDLKWVVTSGIRISFEGKPANLVTIHDITNRKRAEEALSLSEERYRLLLKDANDAVYIHEVSPGGPGVFLEVNDKACEMLGYSREEFLTMSPVDIDIPEQIEKVPSIIEELFTKKRTTFRTEHVAKDGHRVPVEISNSLFSLYGKPTVISIVRDITERENAEMSIKESRRLLQNLLSNLPGMAYRCKNNPEWTMEYVSQGCYELTGYESQALIGNSRVSYGDLIHPDDRNYFWDEVQESVNNKNAFRLTYRIITAEGKEKWVWEQGNGVFSASGDFEAIEGFIADISDRKRIEEALRKVNRQLNLLNSVTRHDISNKITVILGFLALLKTGSPDQAILVSTLDRIESVVQSVQSQIEFTRIYQDLGTHEPRWQGIDQIISRLHVPPDIMLNTYLRGLEIYADPMLEHVFSNLLDNTQRHGEKVTTVRISFVPQTNKVLLIYEDDGSGIPAADKEKIFKHGFGKHTGLGLFLIREILSITGITIRENGVPGKGARFEIMVPDGKYRYSGT